MAMSFEQIVQKILKAKGMSQDELMALVKKKREELGGLITPEGAATIIAKEFKVDVERIEPEVRKLRIEDLAPGMSKVDIVGRVARIYPPKEFTRKDGKKGLRGSLLLRDTTGAIRLTLWDEKTDILQEGKVMKGDAIVVHNAYVRMAIDKKPELSLGMKGEISQVDESQVKELPELGEATVKISDLKPELGEADVVGRVTATSKVRNFERADGTGGKVSTLNVSDGSGSIRVSLWDDWAEVGEKLNYGDAVKLENALVKVGFRGQTELSLGSRGRLVKNPPEAEKIPPITKRLIKVDEVEADMLSLDLAAIVKRIFPQVEFTRKDGSNGRVVSLILADETGTIRASFWDSAADLVRDVKENDKISLKNAYSRRGLNEAPEIHVGRNTSVEINPVGVEVGEPGLARVKIEKIEPNMESLEVAGRVLETSLVREFKRSDGSQGKVSSMTIADETGSVRVSLWNEHAAEVSGVKVGDVVKLADVYSSLGLFGLPEIHLGRRGRMDVNPAGEVVPQAEQVKVTEVKLPRLRVGEIDRERMRIETRGTVVHVFHRRPIFDVCPNCGSGLGNVDTSLVCEECGKVVSPEHRLVISFLLDDGTGNIRVTLFGKVAEQLLGMSTDQVFQRTKENPDVAALYDSFGLVGKEFLVTGVVRHDKFTDQLELRGYDVRAPEPKEEAKLLLQNLRAGT